MPKLRPSGSKTGTTKKVRCPVCKHGYADQATNANGKKVLRCNVCGAQFNSIKM